jgi:methionine sulfoxide reductase heme-binding subunit
VQRAARSVWVYALGMTPLAVLLVQAATKHLGPDWVGEATRRSGRYALAFLFLSLVPGAVQRVSRLAGASRFRRPLGLLAFFYALAHLLTYAGVDYRFDLGLLWADVPRNPFVLLGTAALLLLVPLALTSTDGWVRRLGRNWRRLHRLVYLSAGVAVFHYAWRSKELRIGALWIAALLVGLLLVRMVPLARRLLARRARGDR